MPDDAQDQSVDQEPLDAQMAWAESMAQQQNADRYEDDTDADAASVADRPAPTNHNPSGYSRA